MKFEDTGFEGLKSIEPQVHRDERGYFFESYNEKKHNAHQLNYHWIQDNESKSNYGVIRGLHYQVGDMAQAKLVRVIKGKVLDVVVDIRPESLTYGHCYSIILSEDNKRQLLVPRGFAHGYAVLENQTIFAYKCDNIYSPENEAGLLYSDPKLDIDWLIPEDKRIISDKDMEQNLFKNHRPIS